MQGYGLTRGFLKTAAGIFNEEVVKQLYGLGQPRIDDLGFFLPGKAVERGWSK